MVVLQTAKTTQETAMNHGTKTIELPELTANLLRDEGCLIDNLFADLWKHMGMKARLSRIGFPKRSGTSAHELVYCLINSCREYSLKSPHISEIFMTFATVPACRGPAWVIPTIGVIRQAVSARVSIFSVGTLPIKSSGSWRLPNIDAKFRKR